jgi:hypothetical protein
MSNGQKKGLHPLIWVAVGCGVLVIVGFLVVSVAGFFVAKKVKDVAEDFQENPARKIAELAVAANPDVELVDSDEEEGTLTVRNIKTGEVVTFDYEDAKEGRFRFESDEGEMTLQVGGDENEGFVTMETDEGVSRFGVGSGDQVPAWVPRHPDAGEISGTFNSQSDEMMMGAFSFQVEKGVEDVIRYYESELQSRGFEITMRQTSSGGGTNLSTLAAEHSAESRNVSVTAVEEGGATQVSLQYHQEISP